MALAARAVIGVAFTWIALLIARNLTAGRQWRSNPLGVAAFAVFASATLRNITYFIHAFGWAPDDPVMREASRAVIGSPLAAAWAIVAGAVLLLYLLPWARRDVLDATSLVAWELKRRQHQALRLQQEVQERLDDAARAMQRGDAQACRSRLDEALEGSRRVVGEMLPVRRPMAGRLRSRERGG